MAPIHSPERKQIGAIIQSKLWNLSGELHHLFILEIRLAKIILPWGQRNCKPYFCRLIWYNS